MSEDGVLAEYLQIDFFYLRKCSIFIIYSL